MLMRGPGGLLRGVLKRRTICPRRRRLLPCSTGWREMQAAAPQPAAFAASAGERRTEGRLGSTFEISEAAFDEDTCTG